MDPITCCLLGICCPPNSPEQIEKVSKMLMARDVCTDYATAERVATFLIERVQEVRDALKPR